MISIGTTTIQLIGEKVRLHFVIDIISLSFQVHLGFSTYLFDLSMIFV